MYTVIFADDKKFIFTKEQIMLISYFNVLLTDTAFSEKNIINILSSSIGFEYIHMYATMDEIDIIDPHDKYLFVIKQCDYFGYDKLKTLLEKKYGYKTDMTDVKNMIGKEITVKMKYLGKMHISRKPYPMHLITRNNYKAYIDPYTYNINSENLGLCTFYKKHIYVNNITIGGHPMFYKHEANCRKLFCDLHCARFTNSSCRECHSGYHYGHFCANGCHEPPPTMGPSPYPREHIYHIVPVYEYPDYSTDEEINEIYKKRYIMKHNTYFVKMIQNMILFNKNDVICAKIKNFYKLLSDTTEDEYQNIDYIITDSEPKFNDKYFVKYIDDNIEIYEII